MDSQLLGEVIVKTGVCSEFCQFFFLDCYNIVVFVVAQLTLNCILL